MLRFHFGTSIHLFYALTSVDRSQTVAGVCQYLRTTQERDKELMSAHLTMTCPQQQKSQSPSLSAHSLHGSALPNTEFTSKTAIEAHKYLPLPQKTQQFRDQNTFHFLRHGWLQSSCFRNMSWPTSLHPVALEAMQTRLCQLWHTVSGNWDGQTTCPSPSLLSPSDPVCVYCVHFTPELPPQCPLHGQLAGRRHMLFHNSHLYFKYTIIMKWTIHTKKHTTDPPSRPILNFLHLLHPWIGGCHLTLAVGSGGYHRWISPEVDVTWHSLHSLVDTTGGCHLTLAAQPGGYHR